MSNISSSANCYTRILIAMLVFGCTVFAQDQSKLEGWKPYAPTRLEWLAVNLNAQLRVDFSAHNSYAMGFVPFEKEDAIIIYVSYLPSVDRPTMNIAIETARELIAKEIERRGWAWLKVKEKIELSVLKRDEK